MDNSSVKVQITVENQNTGKEELWEMACHPNGLAYISRTEVDGKKGKLLGTWDGYMLLNETDISPELLKGFIYGMSAGCYEGGKTHGGQPFYLN